MFWGQGSVKMGRKGPLLKGKMASGEKKKTSHVGKWGKNLLKTDNLKKG